MDEDQTLPSWTGGHFLPSAATKVEPLETVVVRPGDTLIVRLASNLSRQNFDEFVEQVQGRLPGVKTLFLTAEQLLVYRPDGTANDA